MRPIFVAVALALALLPDQAAGEFVGELAFLPIGCEQTASECTLKNDFGYVDSEGVGWQAKAGLKTDGASIPAWAQPFVGGAFDKDFVRAAIIHDHYCNRHVRPWRQTHRVFYNALLHSGVDKPKALLMYYAVYLGGPKWVKLIKGIPCQIGKLCIEKVPNQTWPSGSKEKVGEDGQDYVVRSAEYHHVLFNEQLQDAKAMIEARGGEVSLLELERRAEAVKPGNFFYTNPDEIVLKN